MDNNNPVDAPKLVLLRVLRYSSRSFWCFPTHWPAVALVMDGPAEIDRGNERGDRGN